jgi:glucosamine--fructose-6-phosphate aminotransferase (isomerizing)
MREVCRSLEGAFTLVVVDSQQPDLVVAARRSSPLVVGCGTGENFIASDVSAFIEHTREAIELGQDQVVAITPDSVVITDFHGAPAQTTPYHVDWDAAAAEKGGYDWFMLKEIDEQPQAVSGHAAGPLQRAGLLQLDEMRLSDDELREIDKVIIVSAGPRSTPAWSRSTPSSTGRGSRARWSCPASSATATRSWTARRWWCRSASPARPWTR